MSKMSLKEGRVNQKLETRTRILLAARQLLAEGIEITLDRVAEEAEVSRATIYRYFSDVEVLVMEASLDTKTKDPLILAQESENRSPYERIQHVQRYYNTLAVEQEALFRRYLSAVLKASIKSGRSLRGARRVQTLDKVMQPLKKEMSEVTYRNLRDTCAVLMGIDVLVAARDVAGRDSEASCELTEWALEMILKGMELDNKR